MLQLNYKSVHITTAFGECMVEMLRHNLLQSRSSLEKLDGIQILITIARFHTQVKQRYNCQEFFTLRLMSNSEFWNIFLLGKNYRYFSSPAQTFAKPPPMTFNDFIQSRYVILAIIVMFKLHPLSPHNIRKFFLYY